MAARAVVSWEWRWRLGLIALLGIGFGLYSLYDGLVAYPRNNAIRAEWEKLAENHQEETWPERAKQLGVSPDKPDPMKGPWDIRLQYLMAAVTLPIGLLFGVAFLRSLNRWIATDERGLNTSWGEPAPFNAIQNLNKDRWKSKGIAIVTYEGDKGVGKIVLDDWKFTTAAIKQIVREVEEHLRPEQITGGAPEAVAEATTPPPPVGESQADTRPEA